MSDVQRDTINKSITYANGILCLVLAHRQAAALMAVNTKRVYQQYDSHLSHVRRSSNEAIPPCRLAVRPRQLLAREALR